MKKLAVLTALLALAAIPALAQVTTVNYATNYHYNANMNCSDCHSMHASAHNNLTTGTAIETPNTTPGTVINPYYPSQPANGREYLLKNDDVCSTCHDGQTFAPDVIGDHANGYIRSAGGLREGNTGGGHKIGSTVTPPGYDPAVNTGAGYSVWGGVLECYSCHSPHGGVGFRNLVPFSMRSAVTSANEVKIKPLVAKAAAWANAVTPWGTTQQSSQFADVYLKDGDTYVFGSGNLANYYGRDQVTFNRMTTGSEIDFNGSKSSNRMDQFCGVCHAKFHGGEVTSTRVGDGTEFIKHPTSMALIVSFQKNANAGNFEPGKINLKVYQAAAAPNAATDSPGCLSCHKAHGNNNPFGLIYPSVTAKDTTEEGGGIYKTLCKSCHSMGGAIYE